MANYGVTPEETEIPLLPGINDKEVQIQKDAHAWWDTIRSKKSLRGKYRGLTITQIYVAIKEIK